MATTASDHHRHRRGLLRPRNVIGAIVLLIIAFAAVMTVRAMLATPTISVDYRERLTEMAAEGQPTGSNGWPAITDAAIRAVETLELTQDEVNRRFERDDPSAPRLSMRLEVLLPGTQDDSAPQRAREMAAAGMVALEEAGIFDQLDDARDAPRFVRDYGSGGPVIEVLLPDLSPLRTLASVCRVRMWQAAQAGDWDAYVRALDDGLLLADATARQMMLVEQFTGMAIAGLILGEVRMTLLEHAVDPAIITRIEATIDGRLPLASMSRAMEGERMSLHDVVQRTHTDDGTGDGMLILASMAELSASTGAPGPSVGGYPITNVIGYFLPSRKETIARGDAYYDTTIARIDGTSVDPATAELASRELPPQFRLLHIMLPAHDAVTVRQMHDATLRGTIIMLALERHAADTGAYPETLESLAPAFLPALPKDPLAGDGAFIYEQLDDGGYRLYSVGANGVDDGGVESPGLNRPDGDIMLTKPRIEEAADGGVRSAG